MIFVLEITTLKFIVMKLFILSAFSIISFCGISQLRGELPVEKSPMRAVQGQFKLSPMSSCSNWIDVKQDGKTVRLQPVNLPVELQKGDKSFVFDYKILDDELKSECKVHHVVEVYNVRKQSNRKMVKQQKLNKELNIRRVE